MAGAAGTVLARAASGQDVQVSSVTRPQVPEDPTKVVGKLASELGECSPFERLQRVTAFGGVISLTPLQNFTWHDYAGIAAFRTAPRRRSIN